MSFQCSCSDTDEAAKIYDWIIQTKSHMTDVTMETGAYAEGDKYLFLDIDMAILGTSPGSMFYVSFFNNGS